jgi:uroporphyrin-III C-methyltransferase
LPASTPVAVVQSVSLPQQRQALTTLGALCETLAREQMASPAIIVVGDVLAGLAVARSGTDRAAPLDRAA